MKAKYRKGMHLIIKSHGDNGDLIVGRIDSVRTNGKIVGTNLLTGKPFTKETYVLDDRNLICSKSIAVAILTAANGNKKIARQEAVTFARLLRGLSEVKEPPKPKADKKLQRILDATAKMTVEEKQRVFQSMLLDVTKAVLKGG